MTGQAGIPTRYGGVQFRSRLEARWAAFFDLVGWCWEYEPLDLDGYIPDFIVTGFLGRGDDQILVEVKPLVQRFDFIDRRKGTVIVQMKDGLPLNPEWRPAIDTIAASGWKGLWQIHGRECGFAFGHAGDDFADVWVELADPCSRRCWREAGNRVQWRPPR